MAIHRPVPVAGAPRLRRSMKRRASDKYDKVGRRSERRLAYFSAAAALIGALIGAAGAGIPTLIASSDQIAAGNQRSDREFFLEQRRIVYSKFIETSDRLASLHSDVNIKGGYVGGYAYSEKALASGLRGALDAQKKAWQEFYAAYTNLILVCPPEVAAPATDLVQEQADLTAGWQLDEGDENQDSLSITYPAITSSDFYELSEDLDRLRNRFVNQARQSLTR